MGDPLGPVSAPVLWVFLWSTRRHVLIALFLCCLSPAFIRHYPQVSITVSSLFFASSGIAQVTTPRRFNRPVPMPASAAHRSAEVVVFYDFHGLVSFCHCWQLVFLVEPLGPCWPRFCVFSGGFYALRGSIVPSGGIEKPRALRLRIDHRFRLLERVMGKKRVRECKGLHGVDPLGPVSAPVLWVFGSVLPKLPWPCRDTLTPKEVRHRAIPVRSSALYLRTLPAPWPFLPCLCSCFFSLSAIVGIVGPCWPRFRGFSMESKWNRESGTCRVKLRGIGPNSQEKMGAINSATGNNIDRISFENLTFLVSMAVGCDLSCDSHATVTRPLPKIELGPISLFRRAHSQDLHRHQRPQIVEVP